MLNEKVIKKILLEVEASYFNYEEYLNDVITRLLNKDFELPKVMIKELIK